MSAANSVVPTHVVPDGQTGQAGFSLPEELLTRYEVRAIDAREAGERRLGMFLPRDRANPALEIGNDRIVARHEDPETVASLIKIAQHNGWDRIDVDGSPEFRKAIWSAATRAGLTVSGYDPSFGEAEQEAALRRDKAESAAGAVDAVARAAADADASATHTDRADGNDRSASATLPLGVLETAAVEERQDVERTFERGVSVLEESGDPRAQAVRETAAATLDQIDAERDEQSVARSADPAWDNGQRRSGAHRRRESDELAELFLHGAEEQIAADPRLVNALRVQGAMEQHIAEVFQGETGQLSTANLESRQLISDVLRRGLDVSVREPTPVRQIEPIQTPAMER